MSDTYDKEPIKSLSQFYQRINDFENQPSQIGKKLLRPVYRGVQEELNETHLTPSLEWNNLTKYEYELIKEMQRIKPFAFESLKSLELIEKLQHYGMPTRLLDFSLSPYIALYFAVRGEKIDANKRYRVYCMKARESDVVAETIAKISTSLQPFMVYDGGVLSDDIKPIEEILFSQFPTDLKITRTKDFLMKVFSKKAGFVFTYPKFYTERESNQQSFFLIFCNEIFDRFNTVDCYDINFANKIQEDTNILNRFYFKSKIYNPFNHGEKDKYEIIDIDPDAVDELQQQLYKMGVNEILLFSDSIEHITKDVTNIIKKKYSV